MASWTDLSGAFGYGTKLTSAQMQQLRDNITALAEGASGAPRIENAAVNTGDLTYDKLEYNAGDVDQVGAGTGSSYYRVRAADGSLNRTCPNFDDSPTCFPAGSMVLMAGLEYKPIELVETGDMLYSVNGPVEVHQMDRTVLGHRKMFRMADNTIQWSEEHSFFVKRKKKAYIWTMSIKQLEKEAQQGAIGGLKDFSKAYEGKENQQEKFAYIDNGIKAWKDSVPVEVTEYRDRPETRLYLPMTPNGELIVVNGYLVGAGINEFKTDYEKMIWL